MTGARARTACDPKRIQFIRVHVKCMDVQYFYVHIKCMCMCVLQKESESEMNFSEENLIDLILNAHDCVYSSTIDT